MTQEQMIPTKEIRVPGKNKLEIKKGASAGGTT
jgi:hypothetical protein